MNDIKALTPLVQKRTEGIQTYYFQCLRDGAFLVPESRYTYQAAFATEESLIKQIPMAIDGNQLKFSSDQLLDLPAGTYKLEVWETIDNVIHAIYPSDRKLRFTVKENAKDLPNGTVTSLTLDEFVKQFKDMVKDVSSSGIAIDTNTRTITVGDKTLVVPTQVDLSGVVTKDDLEQRLNSIVVPQVTLDVDHRTLTINGQSISVPNSVDMSGYAKTSDVPSVVYNAETKTLIINGQQVSLPSDVDLSNYYTKLEVDNKINTAVTSGKVDLTGYLKVAEAEETYAKKSDIPETPDMSNYVTDTKLQDTLSKLDTSGDVVTKTVEQLKKVTNNDGVDITENFNGAFVTYSKSSGIGVAWLIGNTSISFAFIEGWDNDKHDITQQSFTVIPDNDVVEINNKLSNYATKDSVPSVTYDADKKVLTVNGKEVSLSSDIDLSKYATIEDLNETAQSVEDDANRSIEEAKSTANLALDTANNKLDSSALNDYATNASVDEKIKSVKPDVNGLITTDYGTFLQHEPTNFRVVGTGQKDASKMCFLFDNGAEMHFSNVSMINIAGADGYWGVNNAGIDINGNVLSNLVWSYMVGNIALDYFKQNLAKQDSARFLNWTTCTVKHPYHDSSKYDFDNAHFTKDESKVAPSERVMIKTWFEVGLFSEDDILNVCHVVKKEG